jgi:hypothetical protein
MVMAISAALAIVPKRPLIATVIPAQAGTQ